MPCLSEHVSGPDVKRIMMPAMHIILEPFILRAPFLANFLRKNPNMKVVFKTYEGHIYSEKNAYCIQLEITLGILGNKRSSCSECE